MLGSVLKEPPKHDKTQEVVQEEAEYEYVYVEEEFKQPDAKYFLKCC